MRSLIVVHSYHHGNTARVASAMARALGADIGEATTADPVEAGSHGLLGLGSGIDSGHHYAPLLEYARTLPHAAGRKAFIFSTCGVPARFAGGEAFDAMVRRNHGDLRAILVDKGFEVIGEWACVGFNSNSFLSLFGGLNRGRPDMKDLEEATDFVRRLQIY
jgi:flavodoxin